MAPIDYIIIAVVAVCFILAVYFSVKGRKNGCCGCNGCSGGCEGCGKCEKCGLNPEKTRRKEK